MDESSMSSSVSVRDLYTVNSSHVSIAENCCIFVLDEIPLPDAPTTLISKI